jgi:hypothetical protein
MAKERVSDPDAYLVGSEDPTVRLRPSEGELEKGAGDVISPRPLQRRTRPSPGYNPDAYLERERGR